MTNLTPQPDPLRIVELLLLWQLVYRVETLAGETRQLRKAVNTAHIDMLAIAEDRWPDRGVRAA